MIFCRGCGKQIHETAQNCPQCGAIQGNVIGKEKIHWASIAALISGIIAFLLILSESDGKWDNDTIAGAMIFGAVPISLALYSFSRTQKNGRWMGVTGLILGILVVLIALGSK
jgi:heme/copper-type cytochrome/quinol oxidase subunit 4